MIAWVHHEGRSQGRRPYQEDDYGVFELPEALKAGDLLMVLADGMGGEQAGDIASAIVVRSFMQGYADATYNFIPRRLLHALDWANETLATKVATDPEGLSGMGCTLLAVVLTQEGLYWISVGDSPLWLWRKGQLIRLNQDHSYRYILAQQVAAGKLSVQEAACHPDRNALMSAITGSAIGLMDLTQKSYPLQINDRLLLASDGLLTLSESEITRLVGNDSTKEPIPRRLLKAVEALDYPYQDNVTVMVVQALRSRWRHFVMERWMLGLVFLILVIIGTGWLWWWQPYQNFFQFNFMPESSPPISVSKTVLRNLDWSASGLEALS